MLWIDIDNTPHVQVFRYILEELVSRNTEYLLTARDFAQTKDLLDFYGISYVLIGKHAGKNKFNKILNLFLRAKQLNAYVKNKYINLAISHGSRAQVLSCRMSKINSIAMIDYEYTESKIFNYLADYLLVPKLIPDERLKGAGFNLKKVIKYNGFKEEIYLKFFKPQDNYRNILGISEDTILVILRPPSLVSNYHDKKSEIYLIEILNHLKKFRDILVLINYRTKVDRNFILKNFKLNENFVFMEKPVDGLQLLYTADLLISGGGTMNREAALLGTPTYSIFSGRKPYLDEYLCDIGRLNFINDLDEIYKIEPKRVYEKKILTYSENLVNELVDLFLELKK